MAALPPGRTAPEFSLPYFAPPSVADAGFSLRAALQRGPVLLAFFKVSCPTCQYTFPFLERLHRAHDGSAISVVGISQNNAKDTAAFLRDYGVTFPAVLDDPNGYAVSNAYGLTNVPTMFLVAQDGRIEVSSVGWVKQEIEAIHRKLSALPAPPPLFKLGEEVRDFRAG